MIAYLISGAFICSFIGIYLGVISEICYGSNRKAVAFIGRIFKGLIGGTLLGGAVGTIAGGITYNIMQIVW